MTTTPFTLTPSPADPQVVRVFMLDDCTWWAGYSLQQCIDQARAEGIGDFEDAETEGFEVRDCEMARLKFLDDDGHSVSFAAELACRIAAGESFPQLFAATEG